MRQILRNQNLKRLKAWSWFDKCDRDLINETRISFFFLPLEIQSIKSSIVNNGQNTSLSLFFLSEFLSLTVYDLLSKETSLLDNL